MVNQVFQDRDGNQSSKRIIGAILLVFGGAEKICLFCVGIKTLILIQNFGNLDNSANTFIYTGAGLLGVSVLEFLAPKKDDQQ